MLFDLDLGVWTHLLQKGLKNKDEFILWPSPDIILFLLS